MLTRLSIKGFKNLHQTEVFFGPLTCLSGSAGAGKSNLLEAIRLLQLLAGGSLDSALTQIAPFDTAERAALLRHKNKAARLEFEADVLIDPNGVDETGRDLRATANHLRYQLRLKWVAKKDEPGHFEIEEEQLSPVPPNRHGYQLHFPHANHWRTSLLTEPVAKDTLFIQTSREKAGKVISLVPDRVPAKPIEVLGEGLKATVLSSCPSDFPTAWLLAREMQSWVAGQLPDNAPSRAQLGRWASRRDQQAAKTPGDSGALGKLAAGLDPFCEEGLRFHIDTGGQVDIEAKSGLRLPPAALSSTGRRALNLLTTLAAEDEHPVLCWDDLDQAFPADQAEKVLDLLRGFITRVDDFHDETNPPRQIIFTANDPAWLFGCGLDEWLRVETTSPGSARFGFPRGSWRAAATPGAKGWPTSKWGEPPELAEETATPTTQTTGRKPGKPKPPAHPMLPFGDVTPEEDLVPETTG
ncbi:AAA family ATPase [Acanthopleuribacter pedis]|uniref:Rad50/SbcC-type AAA domain-containing protein n=1 Tax=Acanthopleuribacter pedis TaxID=442870 RepID=A0A8J7Q220_9BACT|nr:AAA family ATPase [Acanthopleuribacter pedis]MBO1317835.1 hypothetical protein [Acanthopleuribacter pedis]